MKTKQRSNSSNSALKLQNILVPIDFSKNAQKALRYALTLATGFGARITLLHVIGRTVYPTEMGMVVTNASFSTAETRKHLVALGVKWIPEKLRGKMLVRVGEPFDEIARVARLLKADLVVCTTHGHTGLKHVLLGSTAERVVRYAPCPVLTIRVR